MATVVLPPTIKWDRAYPQLIDNVSVSRQGDRGISFVESDDPYWLITMRTMPLSNADRHIMEAFVSETKRGMNTVLFIPPIDCIPRAYWGDSANPVLTNTGNLVSITNGDTLNINSVTTGLKLMKGDLISLTTGDYKLIVRCRQDVTAAASAIASLAVDPPIPSYIAAGAVVTFKYPVMNTRLLPNTFSMPDENWPVATFQLQEVPK